jgi:3-phosphoshikimate 1-carboxyvinyltransferase
MVTELRKLDFEVEEHQDGVSISTSTFTPSEIDKYKSHRVSMSSDLLELMTPIIQINNPGCVAKTILAYFEVLDSMRS